MESGSGPRLGMGVEGATVTSQGAVAMALLAVCGLRCVKGTWTVRTTVR